MTQLIPCPGCHRHVRQTESSCPFCSVALSLADVPAAPLPRSRLGRAATFAFGATVVGAAALVGCSGDDDDDGGGKGGAPATAGMSNGGSTIGPVYGAPSASGSGGDVATGGTSAGTSNMGGGAAALYGAPPSGGSQNATAGSSPGGSGNVPLYGAAPAD
jgi:hypothetical protein